MKTKKPEKNIANIMLMSLITFNGVAIADGFIGNKDYIQKGIYAGGFFIQPKFEFKNEYITNLYYKSTDIKDSYIAHYKPGFNVNSNWNRHALNLAVDSDIGQYSYQGANNDYQNVTALLGGRLDTVTDSHFDSSFGYNRLRESRGSADLSVAGLTPTVYDTKVIDNFYTHRFNRISTKLGLNATRYDYDDVLTGAGQTLQMHTRNRWMYTPEIRLGYFIQPQYEAFVKFEYKQAAYDTLVRPNGLAGAAGINRNSTGYNATTGLAFDLTELVTGDISVGYIERNYESSLLKNLSGVNGFLNLKWKPSTLTTLNTGVFRNINETTQVGFINYKTNTYNGLFSGVWSTGVNIGIEHELQRNILLYANGVYNNLDYQSLTNFNRTDNIYSGSVGSKYLINRNFNADLTYTYQNRDSTLTTALYDVNQVMLNLRAQY